VRGQYVDGLKMQSECGGMVGLPIDNAGETRNCMTNVTVGAT
jgi:hypothetical protein